MKKGTKILVNVCYYGVAFLIGVLLAVILPNVYMYDMSMSKIASSLESGNYSDAMELPGGYFDEDIAYKSVGDDGGIVIFNAATLTFSEDEQGNKTESGKLQKSYAGFFWNNNYDVSAEGSKASLTVCSGDAKLEYKLLDRDSNNDGTLDTISTYSEKGFIYFDLPLDTYKSVDKLVFLDKNGEQAFVCDTKLSYSDPFFKDVDEFLNEYNRNYTSEKLESLDAEFRAKSASYKMSSYGNSQKDAMNKAIVWVLVYFVAIYVIGDITIGKRYIIRFFKFILTKFGVKFEDKNAVDEREVIGKDFYSRVSVSLDVSEAESLRSPVTVKYSNETSEAEFLLLSADGYNAVKRIKAGVYYNPYLELDENFEAFGMPDNLDVNSYTTNIIIKIKERKK